MNPSRFVLALLLLAVPAHAAAPARTVYFTTEDKLVFLEVRVNGSRPLTFILDSGAPHTVVDSTAAVNLGLSLLAPDHTTGAGKGSVSRLHTTPLDLAIGEVPLSVEDPWVIDLGQVGGIRHVDGLIGADLFERYVVTLDPVRQTLTMADPSTFKAKGPPIPLIVDQDRLYVNMTLTLSNGVSETHRVRIDTGSADAVSDNLVRRSPEHRKATQGVGLGQSYVDESGVFESVRIGPHTIHRSWGASNDHPAAGMEIFRRFTSTFDASHGRLFLAPNRHFHEPVPAPAPAGR